MNGKELPRAHGHPVRVIVPGRWGEVSAVAKHWSVEQQDDGETQQRDPTDAFPYGATGWVQQTVTVE